jgi:hypothetical protein
MRVNLPQRFRSLLLHAPLYTSVLIATKGEEAATLVMRVENLPHLDQGRTRGSIQFGTWCNSHGTWVVHIPFRIAMGTQGDLEGCHCLNPRSALNCSLILRFSRQEKVNLLFLSADLSDAVRTSIVWSPQKRRQAHQLIEAMDQTLTRERLTNGRDLPFEQAKREFRGLHTAKELLDGQGEGRRALKTAGCQVR